jgi:hypothetical protein
MQQITLQEHDLTIIYHLGSDLSIKLLIDKQGTFMSNASLVK